MVKYEVLKICPISSSLVFEALLMLIKSNVTVRKVMYIKPETSNMTVEFYTLLSPTKGYGIYKKYYRSNDYIYTIEYS